MVVMMCWLVYMTVQGMMQQLQSSPHQHACLIGTLGPLEEEVEEVDGGIVVEGSSRMWLGRSAGIVLWIRGQQPDKCRVNGNAHLKDARLRVFPDDRPSYAGYVVSLIYTTRTCAAAASCRRLRHGRRSIELTGLRATNAPMSVLSDPLH